MEARALAIAFFYAVGTAIGGITGPLLFGHLIESGKLDRLAFGFVLGSVVIALGGVAEIVLGVDAEGKALEEIAGPMSAEEGDEGSAGRPAGEGEPGELPGPPSASGTTGGSRARGRSLGSASTFHAPRMSMAAHDPGHGDLGREVARIERALDEHGTTERAELARLVGARRWGPGRFGAALGAAVSRGRVERRGRRSFAPVRHESRGPGSRPQAPTADAPRTLRSMELRAYVTTLRLAETFTIARSSVDVEDVLHVELEHDGVVAYGEGAPVDYWGETLDGMRSFVTDAAPPLLGDDPFRLEDVLARLAAEPGPRGAKMALDGALHDWVGKRTGLPVYRLLGLSPRIPETSYTIGIDDLEGTADRVRRAERFRRLKVKVGGPGDIERLRIVRELTDVPIRIDGNEGWTLELARELTPELRALGVEFVEQPFPAADLDSFHRYREVADRLPVIVDEGCGDAASVPAIADYADGINIKLSKCGGIREAVRMVHVARALGLQVMLGCMIESELGIAQAAAMAPLVDHVDLDGHLLIADAPFTGLGFEAGRVTLAEAPGLGVEPALPARDQSTAFDPPQ